MKSLMKSIITSYLIITPLMCSSIALADDTIRIYGDSIFNTRNKGVRRELEYKLGQRVEDYSKTGAWAWEIRKLYESRQPEKTDVLILDGGGNDMVGAGCRPFSDRCKRAMADAVRNIEGIIRHARINQHANLKIIVLGGHYPQGWNAGYEGAVNYAYEKMAPVCDEWNTRCTLLDIRGLLKSNMLEWDGIHPNEAGIRLIAEMIYAEITFDEEAVIYQ